MSQKSKFETVEDIKRFKTNLQALKMQKLEFQMFTLDKLANNLVLNKIHQKMRSAGFSDKIIKNTIIVGIEIVSKNKARIHFKSELFADTGYDIALGREEGTDTHKVVAGEGKVLPIPTSSGLIFRKSSNPSGIPALYIIRDTLREMKEPFQDSYNRLLNKWYKANLGDGFDAS